MQEGPVDKHAHCAYTGYKGPDIQFVTKTMISQTTEYALRAVVFLAENQDGGQTTEQIAKSTQIPAAYLSKVLQQLTRASLVQSQRGLRGGFTLRTTADKVRVLDVVNAVDPIRRIRECPLGLPAHATSLCKLHKQLDDATALVEKAFAGATIEDLLTRPKSEIVFTFPPPKTEAKKSTRRTP